MSGGVLYVDDNEADIYLAKAVFSDCRVLKITGIARDGEEGLAYLRREGKFRDAVRPRLVLLDINMPRMNGFELLEAIKASPELRHIPVVLLTGGGLEHDVVRAYRLGACSYIVKPESIERFRQLAAELDWYWTSVARVPIPDPG